MLQIVDRRFNCRMLTAHSDKHCVLSAFPVGLRKAPLSRQHIVIRKLVENEPVPDRKPEHLHPVFPSETPNLR